MLNSSAISPACLGLPFAMLLNGSLHAQDTAQDAASSDVRTIDLTLEGTIELALRNSRMLTNQRLSRALQRYSLRVAENEFRPRFTVGAFGANNEVGKATTETSGLSSGVRLRVPTGGEFALTSRAENFGLGGGEGISTHGSNVNLSFSQPLLRGGGLEVGSASLRNARTSEEINVLAFKSAIISLTSQAVQTYWSYVQAGDRLEIATRSLERGRELLEINKLLVQTGRMAARDVVQAEADIARRELSVITAEGALDGARMSLIDLLDIDSDTYFVLTDTLSVDEVSESTPDVDAGIEIAFKRRSDYLSALLSLSITERGVAIAKNSRLWDLSLTLGTGFRGDGNALVGAAGNLDRTGRSVSLDLNVPVGRGASDPAKLAYQSAVVAVEVARNNLEDLRQRINIEVRNAVRNVDIARRGVVLAETAREFAGQKAEVERGKLSLGLTTNFQLVAFENDLVRAENAELDARVNLLNAVIGLERTLGTTLDRWQIDVERVEFEYARE